MMVLNPCNCPWLRILLAGLVFVVAFPGVLATQSPYDIGLGGALKPPSAEHLFGTDHLGRDIFARVIFGARATLA